MKHLQSTQMNQMMKPMGSKPMMQMSNVTESHDKCGGCGGKNKPPKPKR